MILPFGILLATIALAPLLAPAWWLRHYPKCAIGLGLVTLAYYLFWRRDSHPVLDTAHEYVSFMALIGALYVVSGGIHIGVKAEATPWFNAAFLLTGAVLANVLGTTGASMLLIRPWLRMNQHRIAAYHVVFFIFIVSNVGGCLTPIGDPPLFLGYLMGVPFWWVAEYCLPMWAVGTGALLLMFLAMDWRNYRRAAKPSPVDTSGQTWRFEGRRNLFFLAVILVAVFIRRPPFLSEALMVLAALGSWWLTPRAVHDSNQFNFHPIQEVAILFAGIFATMMPALDWLQANAGNLGNLNATVLYWGSGTLSSALDNAPTYLCFLKALYGRFADGELVAQVTQLIQTPGFDPAAFTGAHAAQIRDIIAALHKYHGPDLAAAGLRPDDIRAACLLGNPNLNFGLIAISVGAVFFGANTYIGNGPNFMVKSIANHQGAPTPTFLGYLFKFTLPFMVPTLLLVWWIFLRH